VGRQALPAPGAGAPECWLRPKATLLRSKEAAPRRRQELVFIGCGLDREGIEARGPPPPPRSLPFPIRLPLPYSPSPPPAPTAPRAEPHQPRRVPAPAAAPLRRSPAAPLL